MAYALETVRVIVLPFEIHAQEELTYLQSEISEAIKKHLKQEDAIILEPEITEDSQWNKRVLTEEEIRNLGIQVGADFVVWGSLTWIDQKFSLDAKLIESLGAKPSHTMFIQGEGIESLPGTVKELSQDLGMKLFKREKVAEVIVTGNVRIESDAIKRKIKTEPGDIFLTKNISEDLKAVYAMGYFEDIRIEAEEVAKGKRIIFRVVEKPTIRVIHIKGNKVYKDKEIISDLDISTGSILNIFKVQRNIRRIEALYKDKNHHNAKVTYDIHPLKNNQADLDFIIEEGAKVRIKKITFEGNHAYTSKQLKKLMENSEKGFFSWLTSSGELDRENLKQDAIKLAAFYQNNGYVQAKVGDPQIEFKGKWIYINIKIDEGDRFRVGKVDIVGDLVLPKVELIKKLKITQEEFYNRRVVQNDVLALTDLYSDEGYAYAEILPRMEQNIEKLLVDITYAISKGKQVYFEKIIIGGNSKTRDKVIRRELKVYEQELFSGRRLKRSAQNLHRLDFFEDIKINTMKGSADDKMILNIDVTEKPTGTLSFGGGYSSVENLFVQGTIAQRNLFGRGQALSLKAELGGRTNQISLSFTEPWLFDIPLSAGFDFYNWGYKYDTYTKQSLGGNLRSSYPVFDYTRVYFLYTYDVADIKDIAPFAAESIKELEGTNVTSSITTYLRYDSRDKAFNPTKGLNTSGGVEYAGGFLGGDIAFTKYTAEAAYYIPLFWSTVGLLHGKGGYVHENTGGILPDYERFYLGGIRSIRGYEYQDIAATDENGDKIGGDKFIQFNIEFQFPLAKEVGVVGAFFYDAGDVYGTDEDIDLGNLYRSVGFGIRWYSPMGPIRVEYGYRLDSVSGEELGGRWEFTMGTVF
jgi:outer membrane protein insertion porin family